MLLRSTADMTDSTAFGFRKESFEYLIKTNAVSHTTCLKLDGTSICLKIAKYCFDYDIRHHCSKCKAEIPSANTWLISILLPRSQCMFHVFHCSLIAIVTFMLRFRYQYPPFFDEGKMGGSTSRTASVWFSTLPESLSFPQKTV